MLSQIAFRAIQLRHTTTSSTNQKLVKATPLNSKSSGRGYTVQVFRSWGLA